MGTATFFITKSGYTNQNVLGRLITSGAHTTTTTVSNLTDGAAGAGSDITGNAGDILNIRSDEDMRIKMGGETATATDGLLLWAENPQSFEITGTGTISIIDVA